MSAQQPSPRFRRAETWWFACFLAFHLSVVTAVFREAAEAAAVALVRAVGGSP